jgi:hypothetical protein
MHAYILYEITRLNAADLNRRAEIHRVVSDARRERRADRQPIGPSRHRPSAPAAGDAHRFPPVTAGQDLEPRRVPALRPEIGRYPRTPDMTLNALRRLLAHTDPAWQNPEFTLVSACDRARTWPGTETGT